MATGTALLGILVNVLTLVGMVAIMLYVNWRFTLIGLSVAIYGKVFEEIDRLLYPSGHPYSWQVIGSMEDLSAASYEDVVEFFKTYYAPGNASLVVAGDIDGGGPSIVTIRADRLGDRLDRRIVQVGRNHARAIRCEKCRDCAPNCPRRTGHDDHFSFKRCPTIHALPQSWPCLPAGAG